MSTPSRLALFAGSLAIAAVAAAADPRLPPRDHEASTQLSTQDRIFIRSLWPDLPTFGPYQYFHWAPEYVEWLRRGGQPQPPLVADPAGIELEGEVNVSDHPSTQAESFIAVDPNDPRYIVAAANDFDGRQRMFSSTDGGVTWLSQMMPGGGFGFHSDPGVGWDSRGNAYTVTLGIGSGRVVNIVSKSTDRGQTWLEPVELPNNGSEDKELLWVDYQRSSPCRDFVYVAWDTPGSSQSTMKFARSTDGGTTFSPPVVLERGLFGIGTTLASGPDGEIYVAWGAWGGAENRKEIRGVKSVDCGATFSAPFTIAPTNQTYDIGIPSFCQRRALIYPALDVDRSFGCRNGWVYVAWTDTPTTGNCRVAGCPVDQKCTTDIFYSYSSDGGTTWAPATRVHEDLPLVDQFNPWLAVDDADGTVWTAFQDTRNDPTRISADVYITRSTDGGASFVTPMRVTAASTPGFGTGGTSFQWGDYNGLSAAQGKVYPIWTDRRAGGTNGGRDDIYVGRIWADLAGCMVGDLDGGGPIGLD